MGLFLVERHILSCYAGRMSKWWIENRFWIVAMAVSWACVVMLAISTLYWETGIHEEVH